MGTITTADGTEIFYKDWGSGQPLVFSHGWPLSADDWDGQMLFFLQHGFRVIAHDRRGHGRSSQTGDGHDRVTQFAEHRHSQAADAAGGAGDDDLARLRRDLVMPKHSDRCWHPPVEPDRRRADQDDLSFESAALNRLFQELGERKTRR